MLRSTFLDLSPLALGASVVIHAAVFVASAGHPGPSNSASDEVVSVDVAEPSPPISPDPAATFTPPVDPALKGPPPAYSNTVSALHEEPGLVSPLPAPASAPAAFANTTRDDTPSFTLSIASTTAGSYGVVSPSGVAPAHERGTGPLAADAVDTRARLVRSRPPPYPPAARAEGFEGVVVLEIIVGISGAVESARVVRAAGHGLDEAALRASYEFRFAPASKEGQPVRVRMLWPMQFRLE